MISIVLTAYKEPKTIGRAIEAFLNQKIAKYELLVLAPDKETAEVIKKYSKKNKKIKYIKDPGKGKPAALNIAFKKAKGEIIVLSDGDVYVSNNSVSSLLEKFKDKKVGAVSGHPVSVNPRKNKFGYWSHLLVDIAHQLRLKSLKQEKFIHCTGYFYAIKSGIVTQIPENTLVDDGYISHKIHEKGYKISYSPDSLVHIKYPDNFKDWVKQKKRSAGGYNQLKEFGISHKERRSFLWESFNGLWRVISYSKNLKELFWSFQLLISRIYLWILIFRDINLKKKNFKNVWVRIESTK